MSHSGHSRVGSDDRSLRDVKSRRKMNSSTNYPRKRRSNAVPTAAAASVSQYTSRMVFDGQKQQRQQQRREDPAPGGDGRGGRPTTVMRRTTESQRQQQRHAAFPLVSKYLLNNNDRADDENINDDDDDDEYPEKNGYRSPPIRDYDDNENAAALFSSRYNSSNYYYDWATSLVNSSTLLSSSFNEGGGENNNSSSRSSHRRRRRRYNALSLLCLWAVIYYYYNSSSSNNNNNMMVTMLSSIPGLSHLSATRNLEELGGKDGTKNDDTKSKDDDDDDDDITDDDILRPEFVYEHPYVSSSYYTSTKSIKTLRSNEEMQVRKNNLALQQKQQSGSDGLETEVVRTRLAIVRPFCEFDAEALPTTFTCWNALPPCKAASDDVGDIYDEDDYEEEEEVEEYEVGPNGELILVPNNTTTTTGNNRRRINNNLYDGIIDANRHMFDLVGSDAMRYAKADVFLFYSQTYSENDVAIKAVDTIIDQFFEPGGWSQCFGNIYAIEANIPQELDLYIPSAQEELYNWVNGPNRQYEAAFRIIQSGEWGDYDGFYLMEGDSVPIKAHWLDVILSEIEVNRPFAVLGAQYDGDKWDVFYEKIPISLLHHTNGNAIYNTSHPLLERLVGQLEIEAPCPYNSIPYDYRMSQMWVEGTLGIVPTLAPKIMLNEEGENITLSNNTEMFSKWADIWEKTNPYKYTSAIHNYAATNLIPRHLGPEYVIHGAKLYSPWDPTKTEVTLVISEWFQDRSKHLIQSLDEKDHPFSEVIIMVPPIIPERDDYDQMTEVPVHTQHRGAPDYMDLCEAEVKTDWFMITNSYHSVARHVDLMFTPGQFTPVIPFTPATYAFCFKYPYCKETVNLAQRINPGHDKVILDMDMLYNTKLRNEFCKEWKEANGDEGEDLYKHQQRRLMFRKKIIGPPGPTGTAYLAYLGKVKKDGLYKLTDRSLYGARPPFVKIFAKEEKLDGMSEDELAKRVGMTLIDNSTDCNCKAFETEVDCIESGIGCSWRPLFESCHPPELIDGGEPICSTTEAPTMSPTVSLEFDDTESPTSDTAVSDSAVGLVGESDPWYINMFKSREHESLSESNSTEDSTLMADDDDAILEPQGRKLSTTDYESFYDTNLTADQRMDAFAADGGRRRQLQSIDAWYGKVTILPPKSCTSWDPSIVPRNRTVSIDWDGPSIDPESRSFTATATARPRKLHGSYLRYQTLMSQEQQSALSSLIDSTSPMKDSWITSSIPINKPKYDMYGENNIRPKKNTVLFEVPSTDHKTFNTYEHGDTYNPIRITFITDHLLSNNINHDKSSTNANGRKLSMMDTITKIEALSGDILPSVSEVWAGAISLLRSGDNLFPYQDQCGEATIPPHHLSQGVPSTDTLIYITVNGSRCIVDGDDDTQSIVSFAAVCSFDQNMRPISANIDICLEHIKVFDGEVLEEEILRLTSELTIEVGKILGLSPTLYHHYRNSESAQPFGSTEKSVICVDGTEMTTLVPNILHSTLIIDASGTKRGVWEVITPTVRQVVRNHFDCQSLSGATLAAKMAESSSCFGDSFDPRYHFDEDFTSIGSGSSDMAYSLSPLTLALLEDSGWYRANFDKSTVPLFGRGAGCGFVKGNCIGESKAAVPDYSQGFFCNDLANEKQELDQPSGCDYTHNHKAECSSFGLQEPANDVCPMRMTNIKSCSDKANLPSLTGEIYSPNSRCFTTDTPMSVCLESYCNSIDFKLDIVVNEKVLQCDYEGQDLDLGYGYTISCPRVAVVCPHLACPANCSGKGICDYCLDVPVCICDNPFDKTLGCYGV